MFYTMGVEDCLETLYPWAKSLGSSKSLGTGKGKGLEGLEGLEIELEASADCPAAQAKLQCAVRNIKNLDSILFESLCLISKNIELEEREEGFEHSDSSSSYRLSASHELSASNKLSSSPDLNSPASPPPRPWGGGRIFICPQQHWGPWDYCEALIDQLNRQLMKLDDQRRSHYLTPQVWPLLLRSQGEDYKCSTPPPELRELVLKFLSSVEVLLFRRRLRGKLLNRSSLDINFLESPGKVFPNTAELLLLGYQHLISLQTYRRQGWLSSRLLQILSRAESHLNAIHLSQRHQVPLAATAQQAAHQATQQAAYQTTHQVAP